MTVFPETSAGYARHVFDCRRFLEPLPAPFIQTKSECDLVELQLSGGLTGTTNLSDSCDGYSLCVYQTLVDTS